VDALVARCIRAALEQGPRVVQRHAPDQDERVRRGPGASGTGQASLIERLLRKAGASELR
jgi:hypothetical protein